MTRVRPSKIVQVCPTTIHGFRHVSRSRFNHPGERESMHLISDERACVVVDGIRTDAALNIYSSHPRSANASTPCFSWFSSRRSDYRAVGDHCKRLRSTNAVARVDEPPTPRAVGSASTVSFNALIQRVDRWQISTRHCRVWPMIHRSHRRVTKDAGSFSRAAGERVVGWGEKWRRGRV